MGISKTLVEVVIMFLVSVSGMCGGVGTFLPTKFDRKKSIKFIYFIVYAYVYLETT